MRCAARVRHDGLMTNPGATGQRGMPAPGSGVRTIGARAFDFSRQVAVMAIVNRTPDSFYDQGATFAEDAALRAVARAVDVQHHDDQTGPRGVAADAAGRLDILRRSFRLAIDDHHAETVHVHADRHHVRRQQHV